MGHVLWHAGRDERECPPTHDVRKLWKNCIGGKLNRWKLGIGNLPKINNYVSVGMAEILVAKRLFIPAWRAAKFPRLSEPIRIHTPLLSVATIDAIALWIAADLPMLVTGIARMPFARKPEKMTSSG